MPKIGLSGMYVADYAANDGVVSYTNGKKYGRAVGLDLDVESSDAKNFYSDNVASETISGVFTGGTAKAEVAEFSQPVLKQILGIKTRMFMVDGVPVTELVYDDNSTAPYVGYGWIVKNLENGKYSWDAYVAKKIAFNVPALSVKTQGEEIEWQTETAEANLMRDDTSTHEWQNQAKGLATEELADKYVRTKLNIPFGSIGSLQVTSTAGATGKTKLQVTPELTVVNSYMVQVAANPEIPFFEQEMKEEDGFTEWDGTKEITAKNGEQVLVVEVDASGLALKFGKTIAVTA